MVTAKLKSQVVDLSHDKRYQAFQKHLKLQGVAPATVKSYSRAFREALLFFGARMNCLSREDLSAYLEVRLADKSPSIVSIDVCALKFYTRYALQKPWHGDGLFKLPRRQRLPDIVTVGEVQRLVDATQCLSYRVFYFTMYSLGLRLSEGRQLRVADVDAARGRVHIRQSKNRKDRLVPLPRVTLDLLRRFWAVHRNPQLMFPSRAGGLSCSSVTNKPLDASGVQKALHRVCEDVGLKKTSPHTAYATVTPRICSKQVSTCCKCSVFSGTAT